MMMAKSELEKFRTRWHRWLGNKTRFDKEAWTTLLDSTWTGWVDRVLGDSYRGMPFHTPRETVKELYRKAINRATMDDLRRLDGLYATEKVEKQMRRR
jgi:hypothetical protein